MDIHTSDPENTGCSGPSHLRRAAAVCLGALVLLPAGCGEQGGGNTPEGPERPEVTMAVAAQPISALVYVADSLGFFAAEGLAVELVSRPTGETALEEVIRGRAQFATTAETPVVHAALSGDSAVVLATVATTRQGLVVMARSDHGVETAADLRGKRVGVTFDINAEFFLELFLTLRGVPRAAVELVDTSPDSLVGALTAGRVDAVVAWEPRRSTIERRLGPVVRVLSAPEIYTWFWNVVAMRAFADVHPRTGAAVLRALRAAREYMAANPAESRRIVAGRLRQDPAEIEASWAGIRFILSLDQALVVSMEDQALWLLDGRNGSPAKLPNMLRLVDARPLLDVAPDAVSILGVEGGR